MLETAQSELTPITLKLFSDKTRDLLLKSSLVLFNERGFSNVTTSSIAVTSGVLEGSLWYHFKTKKDLLSAHIRLLEKVFFDENQTVDSKELDIILKDIFTSYNLIWDFRYILRDNFQISLKDDLNTMDSVVSINNSLDRWVENRIKHSNHIGLLNIPSEEIENLSEIILVLGRYWLDFSEKKYPNANNKSLRLKGLKHIFMVLSPYISPKASPMISDMLMHY